MMNCNCVGNYGMVLRLQKSQYKIKGNATFAPFFEKYAPCGKI